MDDGGAPEGADAPGDEVERRMAELVAAERAARDQLQAFVRAGQALSASLTLRDVLAAILRELRHVVPYDTASVQELRGDAMVIVGGAGIDMDVFENLGFDVVEGRVPNADVVRTRAPLIVEDILGDHGYVDFPNADHARSGVRCWMGVPMLFGGACIGMLTLDSYEPGFYTEAHAEVALAYAAQAAIALQNARAFDQARRELEERRRAERELREANRALQQQMAEIEALQESLREQARRDPLTGLYNRRHLLEVLEAELAAGRSNGRPVSLVMVDVDHFKAVNDTFGHSAGDRVLEAVGDYLRAALRPADLACRYGGEEFVVVLPGVTAAVARERAECWRRAIEALASEGVTPAPVTISAGVAEAAPGWSRDELLRTADLALYEAKAAGRNVVVVAG